VEAFHPMKSFLPRFRVATLTAEPARFRSKIGGVPWGLPIEKWPYCCNAPQKLLAQILHEPPYVNLGGDFVLYLFQCLECCGIDQEGRGVALVKRSDISDSPVTVADYDRQSELGESLIGELFFDGWDMVDDGIPESRLTGFFEERRYWALQDDFPEIRWFADMSRFGGSPRWTGNGPLNPPSSPFEFLFQLNTWLDVPGPPPSPAEIGCPIHIHASPTVFQRQSRTKANAPWSACHDQQADHFSVEFTNLGTDGALYVFIDRTPSIPSVMWYWNR